LASSSAGFGGCVPAREARNLTAAFMAFSGGVGAVFLIRPIYDVVGAADLAALPLCSVSTFAQVVVRQLLRCDAVTQVVRHRSTSHG
jgi:hypothetical protein